MCESFLFKIFQDWNVKLTLLSNLYVADFTRSYVLCKMIILHNGRYPERITRFPHHSV